MPAFVGSYSPEDLMQTWFINKLPTAKEALSHFSTLNNSLDSFANYERRLYKNTRNSIMFLCLPRFDGYRPSVERLEKIESALSNIQVNNWPLSKYNALKSRISSENFDKSYSVQTELEAVADLLPVIGKQELTLYPELKHGRYSDLRLALDGRTIYIEIGNLAESLPEKKIDKILADCAEHLGKQMGHSYIQVMVDTAEFVFSPNGVMDTSGTIEKINSN